jgi:hypothetical protein
MLIFQLTGVALFTLGGPGGRFFVTPDAPDVEWIFLGAHLAGVGDVRIHTMALEAAFRVISTLGGVVTYYAVVFLLVGLVWEGDGGLFGLGLVDDDDFLVVSSDSDRAEQGCAHGKCCKQNDDLPTHFGTSFKPITIYMRTRT